MHVVILAGGGGTRLWPLSSPGRPKPFLPLLGQETLLQRTVARLFGGEELRAVGLTEGDLSVVTDRRYRGLVEEQLPGIRIVAEPVGRNTAAAIALAALAVDRPDDEVMIVLPADHTIEKEAVFRAVLVSAHAGLAVDAFGPAFGTDDPLMTLGIRVDHPATEYGYLVPFADRRAEIEGLPSYPLRAFEEKPLPDRARELVHEEGVAWNAGMFLWRRRAIRAALEQYTDLTTVIGPVIGSQRALAAAYERLGPTSIDYAVMEPAARAGRVVMGSMDVGWSDLGGWPALLDALGCRPTGRVLPAGEAAELGPGDLLVERRDGRLAIVDGPRGSIRSSGPTALLAGAVSDRPTIEALLARVAAHEVHP